MLVKGDYSWLIFFFLIAFSIIPIISIIGKIFTRPGRDSLAANPLIFMYFIIFFTYAYFFWMAPYLIEEYIGMNDLYQKLLYGALAVVPFFERDIPN